MKKDIHPQVYTDCAVKCACGNTFTTISTVPSITIDICSACHPFFTGQQKFVDTEGRIDKFQKKRKQMEDKKKKHAEVKAARKGKKDTTAKEPAPTLKELMKQLKEEEEADAKNSTQPAKEETPSENTDIKDSTQ